MPAELERESTEYLFVGATGDVPSGGVEVAYTEFDQRPVTWYAAVVIPDAQHALWAAAQRAHPDGAWTWFYARLIGPFNNDVALAPAVGDGWQAWSRHTDVVERPVRRDGVVVIL